MLLNSFYKDWRTSSLIEPEDNALFKAVKTAALDVKSALAPALSPSPGTPGGDSGDSDQRSYQMCNVPKKLTGVALNVFHYYICLEESFTIKN